MTKKNKTKFEFTREHKFLLFLFILLLLDICVHLFHPAYKYYKQVSKKLQTDNETFQKKIIGEIVPSISLVASNSMIKVTQPLQKITSSFSQPSKKELSFPTQNLPQNSFYFVISSRPYISVDGFYYTIGDNFDGSPIKILNPLFMQTKNARYNISNSFRPLGAELSKPIQEGDIINEH